jgi:hypothetical protein
MQRSNLLHKQLYKVPWVAAPLLPTIDRLLPKLWNTNAAQFSNLRFSTADTSLHSLLPRPRTTETIPDKPESSVQSHIRKELLE